MDEEMELVGKVNAYTNLLSQIGDVDTLLDAGAIDRDEYTELKARKLAYATALQKLSKGVMVSDDDFAAILEEMFVVAAQPTQAEMSALHEAAIVELAELYGGE